MDLLKGEIQKNGFLYKLYKKGEKAYMYEQSDPREDAFHAYEVFKIRIDKPKEIFGIQLPEREKFPGNEDFGKWAWSCNQLDRALIKFELIETGKIDEE